MNAKLCERSTLRVLLGGDAERLAETSAVIREDLGHEVVEIAESQAEIVRAALILEPDALVFTFGRTAGFAVLRQIYAECVIPAVAIVDPHEEAAVRAGLKDFALSYTVGPVVGRELATALFVAIGRAEAHRQLTLENEKLRQTLENRKVIERAKGMLMMRHRWSENDAFRRLQRSAMNQRTSMAQLAQAVISGATVSL